MKCKIIIDKAHEEEVIGYVHEKNVLAEKIENIVLGSSKQLLGFDGRSINVLDDSEIYCFTVEDGKVYALTHSEKLRLKQRLYEVEECIGSSFVKINQSCIVNMNKIHKFDASFSGGLSVIMKNGYKDYISRRQLKKVKERMGF